MTPAIRRRNRPGLEGLEPRSLLSGAGSPDPSFGAGTGSATIPLGVPNLSLTASYQTTANSVVVAPGGKIIVTGSSSNLTNPKLGYALSVARFNADGAVDTTFGVGGLAQLPIGEAHFATAVQPDGSIIEATGATDGGGNGTYLAVRLTPSGTLDTSFGTNGVANYPASTTTAVADRLARVVSVLIQSNGQVILAGGTSHQLAAVRLDADGSLDTSYGQSGTAIAPITVNGVTSATADGAAIQSNGQVVVAGVVLTNTLFPPLDADEAAVARFNADGSVDTAFGTSGSVTFPIDPNNSMATGTTSNVAVAVDPTDQKIVVSANIINGNTVGRTTSSDNVYRLNADGSTDTTFGTNGVATPSLTGYVPDLVANTSIANASVNQGGALAVDSSGRIVELVGGGDTAVVRLNADGSTDKGFGNSTTLGPYQPGLKSIAFELSLAIQPTTGAVVLAGTGTVPTLVGRLLGYTVAQLLPSASTGAAARRLPPTPPASFERSGLANVSMTNLSVYLPAYGDFAYRPIPSYFTNSNPLAAADVITPFGAAGAGQTLPAVADYLGDGQAQIGIYLTTAGVYVVKPTDAGPGLAIQFGAPGLGNTIPVPADYEGTGQDDVAVYLTGSGVFAILPSDGGPQKLVRLGTPGPGRSIPAPADYYGTGQDDIAVYLAQMGAFAVQDPTGKTPGEIVPFGVPGVGRSIPVPGDYDGSGHVEFAVYVPSQGAFYYRPYGTNGSDDKKVLVGLPGVGEIPAVGDYDGVGQDEFAIYDPKGGFFEIAPANGGPYELEYFGSNNGGSLPVATPSADLPVFTGESSGSSGGAIRVAPVASASAASASTAAVAVARSSAVPAGPTWASIRVARTLVNQGSPGTPKPIA